MCSNEPECVACASSRNFTRGSTPREGTRCVIFKIFLHKPSPVRTECACLFRFRTDKRRGPQTRTCTHTHTHTQTDRQFELYILDMRTSALVIWIYGKAKREINKTTMPDECKFDSVTYALKIQARDPFRGADSIVICWRQESNDSRFCSPTRLKSKGD